MIRHYLFIFLLFPLTVFSADFNLGSKSLQGEDFHAIRVFTFSNTVEGWKGGFTDYPVGAESFYELAWGWENLPAEAVSSSSQPLTKGLFLAGNNHSDDLFMFVKREIGGLQPNTVYALNFSILIESNVPTGTMGIGGSPGESVYFKVGASSVEPKKMTVNGFYLLNVDKGNQAMGGENALVIGDLANEAVDPNKPEYVSKELLGGPLLVESGDDGKLWIFLGTDSGFEGTSKYYIAEIRLETRIKNQN